MSDVGTAQIASPPSVRLPSAHGQLPKTAAFWLMAVIFAALLFSASAADAALCGLSGAVAFLLHDPDRHIRRLRPWRFDGAAGVRRACPTVLGAGRSLRHP